MFHAASSKERECLREIVSCKIYILRLVVVERQDFDSMYEIQLCCVLAPGDVCAGPHVDGCVQVLYGCRVCHYRKRR